MSEYSLMAIHQDDWRSVEKVKLLLEKEGIEQDPHLDYVAGLFNDDYKLIATGSCFHKTLRCLAVDSDFQGEGLLNEIVSHLLEVQLWRGNRSIYLYTKCNASKFFSDIDFHEIARIEDRLVFMENIKGQFSRYIEHLVHETAEHKPGRYGKIAAVVMNANPFTLGHQYLLETASSENDLVHVFVVSEDASVIPFDVRYRLLVEGSRHLKNLVYHLSGDYIISNETFPSYFLKTECVVIEAHADLDIAIFKAISKALGITRRYVSEEPFSKVTAIYNRSMETKLPEAGIEFIEIPRRTDGGIPISASEVRVLLKTERMKELKSKLPDTTYNFFLTDQGRSVIKRIQASTELVHY